MTISIDLRAIGSGYFRVLLDGIEVSKHLQEREAAQEAETLKRLPANATRDVRYVHDYTVIAELTGEGPPPPEPVPDPDPTPDPVPEPPPAGASLTPAELVPALSQLIARQATQLPEMVTFDQRFMANEQARYDAYAANPTVDVAIGANHYGGLRSRLQWAIRIGEAYGPGVTDTARYAYARGRSIVLAYLAYSKANNYATQAHNNTGMPDIEALYRLEGNADALTHIHVTAMTATYDPFGYLKMQNANSDARQIAVAMQAFNAAHRLGIPYARSPANTSAGFDAAPGSWKAAGTRQIAWLTQYAIVKPDGSVPSAAHGGAEAYLFDAMLATELLRWYGYVEPVPADLALATRIMDHLIVQQGAAETLPYLSSGGAAAPDLAAFYVWPGLALWQETGDAKYKTFALTNLAATQGAFVAGVKQWNQTYSTGAENAEALLAGVRWR